MSLQSPGQALTFEVLDDIGAQARQHPLYCSWANQLAPPGLEPISEDQPTRRVAIFRVSQGMLIGSFSQFREQLAPNMMSPNSFYWGRVLVAKTDRT